MMNIQQQISLFKLAMRRKYPRVELQGMYNELKKGMSQVDCTETNCTLIRIEYKSARADWKIIRKVAA